ncbi:MAG: hypothetical protein JNL43_07135 [Flavobacteriales bacterium]|nr:hypothetical protein [Flavobacteriales bacterium]HRH70951.1 hypothetical protein [Flavobacteriales bacterium]
MDPRCFCTIITRSHLSWALALVDSVRQFDRALPFCILVTDTETMEPGAIGPIEGVEVLFLKDVAKTGLGRDIATKYADKPDELRWSLKPVLMLHLHQRYTKVIYGDCDLHFFNDPGSLWHELDDADMLLSPHFRSGRATVDRANFAELFVGGLYNGGFVASTHRASAPLTRWAENCLEVCVKDLSKGQYVDQTHLNLLPIYFDRIKVIKHRGCNVANWNMVECRRERSSAGEVLINGVFPIIFIHFTRSTIDGIVSGVDGLLMEHVSILRDRLLAHGSGKDIILAAKERLARKAEAIVERGFFERGIRYMVRKVRRS